MLFFFFSSNYSTRTRQEWHLRVGHFTHIWKLNLILKQVKDIWDDSHLSSQILTEHKFDLWLRTLMWTCPTKWLFFFPLLFSRMIFFLLLWANDHNIYLLRAYNNSQFYLQGTFQTEWSSATQLENQKSNRLGVGMPLLSSNLCLVWRSWEECGCHWWATLLRNKKKTPAEDRLKKNLKVRITF